MMRRELMLRASLVLAFPCGGLLFPQNPPERPVEEVDAQRNPNLAAAQKLCAQAFEEVTKAQKANNYDMKGHAAKAKELLIRASQELSEADKIAESVAPVRGPSSGTSSKNPASGKMSTPVAPSGHAQFEPASVAVPAGNDCVLHPEGNPDPSQSIPVRAGEDGVARFHAVRPTLPDSIDRLALDCTDSNGSTKTYPVDLRSEETFAPRPFDPSRTTLALRPALSGDPLRFTQEELIKAGCGLRPDPEGNPDGYQRWLDAVSVPAYKLRKATRPSSAPPSSRQGPMPQPFALSILPELDARPYTTQPSSGWTGAVLSGSYQKNKTAALTYSYAWNEAWFNVPKLTPGGFGTGATAMTIWNGLDNVFQAIVDVNATATTASYGIHHQFFYHGKPHAWSKGNDTGGTRFTPNPGDTILADPNPSIRRARG